MSKEDIRQGIKKLFSRPSHKNLYPWLVERGIYAAFLNCMAYLMREWFLVMMVAGALFFMYVYEFVAKGR